MGSIGLQVQRDRFIATGMRLQGARDDEQRSQLAPQPYRSSSRAAACKSTR